MFGELDVFAGPNFVITVRHGDAPVLGHVRRTLEARPELLARGPVAVVYGMATTSSTATSRSSPASRTTSTRSRTRSSAASATVSRRIYELTREVIEFQRATKPLAGILGELIELPGVDDEERRYLRDVQDHAMRIEERVDGFRVLLQNILSVHLTLETKALNEVSVNQNEQVQKISAWAAILFAPTLIGTIYGMNFKHMPELDWRLGYPMALGLMLLVSLGLYLIFKRRRWI